jgi:hypothetical protein
MIQLLAGGRWILWSTILVGAERPLAVCLVPSERRPPMRSGSCGRSEIRLPADCGASTAMAALPESLDAQRVGAPQSQSVERGQQTSRRFGIIGRFAPDGAGRLQAIARHPDVPRASSRSAIILSTDVAAESTGMVGKVTTLELSVGSILLTNADRGSARRSYDRDSIRIA